MTSQKTISQRLLLRLWFKLERERVLAMSRIIVTDMWCLHARTLTKEGT